MRGRLSARGFFTVERGLITSVTSYFQYYQVSGYLCSCLQCLLSITRSYRCQVLLRASLAPPSLTWSYLFSSGRLRPRWSDKRMINIEIQKERYSLWREGKWSIQGFSIEDSQAWVGCPDGRCLLRQRNGVVRNRNRSDDVPEEDETQSQEEGKEGQSFLLWLQPWCVENK